MRTGSLAGGDELVGGLPQVLGGAEMKTGVEAGSGEVSQGLRVVPDRAGMRTDSEASSGQRRGRAFEDLVDAEMKTG